MLQTAMLSKQKSDKICEITCILFQRVLRSDISENIKILGILFHPGQIYILSESVFPSWSPNFQGAPDDCLNC